MQYVSLDVSMSSVDNSLCNALKDLVSADSDSEDDEHTSNGKVMNEHTCILICYDIMLCMDNLGTITALRCVAYFLCKKVRGKK